MKSTQKDNKKEANDEVDQQKYLPKAQDNRCL